MYNVPRVELCLSPGEVHGENGSCQTFQRSAMQWLVFLFEFIDNAGDWLRLHQS